VEASPRLCPHQFSRLLLLVAHVSAFGTQESNWL
jgi:hypothetical protein